MIVVSQGPPHASRARERFWRASGACRLLAGPLPILLGSTSTLTLIGVLAAVALPLSWFALPETLGVTLANVGTTTRDAED